MYEIGWNIRELRLENNMTQELLGKKVGVSVNTIRNWESSAQFPSTERIIALAKIFHVTIDNLAGIDKDKKLVLDSLSQNQKNLLKTIALEFQDKSNKGNTLTNRQKDIISGLYEEFNKQKE